MIAKLKRVSSRLTRSIASLPLRLLGPEARASALEELSEKLICKTEIPCGVIRFYAPSPLLRFRASTVLSKEVDTIQWINNFEDGEVFWDIGANVGVYSLYAAISKNMRVQAFEPSAGNFFALTRNAQLNNVTDRMSTYCIAFSERVELGVLNLTAANIGGSLNQFGPPGSRSPFASNDCRMMHGMLGISIDAFIAQFSPSLPTYMKIDVDGLELSILKGARKTLSDPLLRELMIELSVTNKCENKEAMELLAACGWKLVSRGQIQGRIEQAANHFFERPADGE